MPDDSTPRPESKKIGCKGCLLILLTGFFLFLAFAGIWIFTAFNSAPEPGQPLFQPNKAANYITSPLDANGDVDYVAYFNQEASKNVTPENNAMAKIAQAIGPTPNVPVDFFFKLGIDPPSPEGNYFVEFENWHKSSAIYDEAASLKFEDEHGEPRSYLVWDFTYTNPWNQNEFPELVAYIDALEPVFQQAIAASNCQYCYAPIVVESPADPIFAFLLPYHQHKRDLARLLVLRSNMYLGQSKISKAIDDAFTIARLGECTSNGHTLIDYSVSLAIRGIGYQQLVSIARHPATEKDDLLRLRELAIQLRSIDRVPTIASKYERLMALDGVSKMIRHGQGLSEAEHLGLGETGIPMLVQTSDAEAAMVQVNKTFDLIESVFEKSKADPTFDYAEAFEEINLRIRRDMENPMKNYFLLLLTKKARGRRLGNVLGGMLLPACDSVWNAERRTNSNLNLLRLIIEIELYEHENGDYPDSLDQLVPDQLAKLPSDPFAQLDQYGYRKNDAKTSFTYGYRVYSFGQNQVDDNGRNPSIQDSDSSETTYNSDDWFFEDSTYMTWQEYLDDRMTSDDMGMGLGLGIDTFLENEMNDSENTIANPGDTIDSPDTKTQEAVEENNGQTDENELPPN